MLRSLGQSFLDWCSRYSTWGLAVGVLVLIVLHTTGFGGFQIDFVTVGLLALLFLIPQFGDLERLAVGNLEATFNQEQVNESFAKQGQAALSEPEGSTKAEETDASPAADSAGVSHTELSADARASLTFPPQRSAGHAIVLDEICLSHPGFVAVHDDSLLEGETFASIRGHSAYLTAGQHKHVAIGLQTPLDQDAQLIAIPYLDTNDNCEFDFLSSWGSEDGPVVHGENIYTKVATIDVVQ